MEEQTIDIIMVLKNGFIDEKGKDYTGIESLLHWWLRENGSLSNATIDTYKSDTVRYLLRNAFFDYLDECDNVKHMFWLYTLALDEYRKYLDFEKMLAKTILTDKDKEFGEEIFALKSVLCDIQIRKKNKDTGLHECINGFSEELLRESHKRIYNKYPEEMEG